MNKRTCTRCKQEQPLDSFYVDKHRKDGLVSHCKTCFAEKRKANPQRKEYSKKHYQLNKERHNENSKKNYLNNRKKRLAKNKQWCAENRQRVNELAVEWRKNNLEKRRQYEREYREANPERVKEIVNKRRTKRLNNGIYEVLKKEIIRLYNSPCIYCGSIDSIEADHVIPISRGGTHSIGNLVPACQKCNRSKSDKYLVEWRLKAMI